MERKYHYVINVIDFIDTNQCVSSGGICFNILFWFNIFNLIDWVICRGGSCHEFIDLKGEFSCFIIEIKKGSLLIIVIVYWF